MPVRLAQIKKHATRSLGKAAQKGQVLLWGRGPAAGARTMGPWSRAQPPLPPVFPLLEMTLSMYLQPRENVRAGGHSRTRRAAE